MLCTMHFTCPPPRTSFLAATMHATHLDVSAQLVERRAGLSDKRPARLAALEHALFQLARAQSVSAAIRRPVLGRRVRSFRMSGVQQAVLHASAFRCRFAQVHRAVVVRDRGGQRQQQSQSHEPRERVSAAHRRGHVVVYSCAVCGGRDVLNDVPTGALMLHRLMMTTGDACDRVRVRGSVN